MTTSSTIIDPSAVLAQMTLEEKASLLDGLDFWHTQPLERLDVPAIMVTDGPNGLRKQADAADHLGLNNSVPATCFPPAAGLASSWDVGLVERVGEALGDECRAEEVAVLLGPGVNMKRSPLCGRNFEYFSEDPLLAGEIASGWINGVQSRGVGVSMKHFAANNQETDRMTVSAEIDERTLREIYLPAFERAVKQAQPWTVMCSYNKLNGTYASEHPWLLTELLRDQWGFEGLVVSDWGAVNERDRGVAAGLDLEMPSSGGSGTKVILDAVAAGTLSEGDVDRAALRVLELVANASRREPLAAFDVDAHHTLAREAARSSAVLLKNEGSILPLDPDHGGPIAVIGEFARTPRFQGAGSSQVNPTRIDNALESLQSALDGKREVLFAPGFEIDSENGDAQLIAEAVAAAKAAKVAVVFLGLPPSYESEGYDREHMELPSTQLALLEAVSIVNPNVVVVLSNGSAVLVSDWQHQCKALLEGWLLGQAGGGAIADLLLGVTSPSGKLAETIPARFLDNPAVGNFPGERRVVRYGEGLLIGYRWYDARQLGVAYPFGHGLSYTTFEYSELAAKVVRDGADPQVTVTVKVTNSGNRAGSEIVQVYVSDPESSVYRPVRELRGFAKVTLAPGASEQVTVELDQRAFAYWHTGRGDWVVEGGEFGIEVGASSRDIRLRTKIKLAGGDASEPLTLDSNFDEYLAQPDAAAWLHEKLADDPIGSMLFDPQHGRMFRAIPVIRFLHFPNPPISESEMREFLASRSA